MLDETFTLLFKRVPFGQAQLFVQHVDEAVRTGHLHLEWVGPERFDEAQSLRLQYQEKPGISFTDLTSIVVMEELELTHVLTGDAHFEQVGSDFRRVPRRE